MEARPNFSWPSNLKKSPMVQILPGGKAVLFTLATAAGVDFWDKAQIVVQTVATGKRQTLIQGGSDARFLATGHIVYAIRGTLFAVAFDSRRLEVKGGASEVLEGVRRAGVTGTAQYAVSNTGSLVYISGPAAGVAQHTLALVDRNGGIEPLRLPSGPYEFPRISPDGKRIAYDTDDGKEAIVWIYELSGTSTPRRLTYGGSNRYPIWSTDGEHLAFQSDREGNRAIFWQRADGKASAERLTKPDPGGYHVAGSWSPDRQRFLFRTVVRGLSALWIFSLQDKKVTPFAEAETVGLAAPEFSPDGHWVVYSSNESGRTDLDVQPYPPTGEKHQIPNGNYPLWSRDGKELFYTVPPLFFTVRIATQPDFTFGNPVPLPNLSIEQELGGNFSRNFDIMPDGKRFIGLIPSDQLQSGAPAAPQIQVVLNWFEDLKRRVPVH
jgi:serine/threonine-protein kinase